MPDIHDPASISRRSMLAGAGGIAGAAALATAGATPALAGPVPADPSWGTAGAPAGNSADIPAGAPAAPTPPGMHFKTYGMFAFNPNFFTNGKAVGTTGAHCSANDGFLVVPVDLPPGSTIVNVNFYGQNSSGLDKSFFLERYPVNSDVTQQLVACTMPTGAALLQSVNGSLSHTTDALSTYDAAVLTTASGTVRIFSLTIGYFPPSFGFLPITPTRVYDSRSGNPPLAVVKGQLSNGTRVINCFNGLTPPSAVKGVLTNLTVLNASSSGFLALYANGIPAPATSSINWFTANEIVANNAYTNVDSSGNAVARVPVGSSCDFFIDVVGYYL